MDALELREAFLQSGLKLPGLESAPGLDGRMGGQQRKDSVGANLPP